MAVTTGWLMPSNPAHGDVWQRNSGISFTWDDNLALWIPTDPPDAFAGLIPSGGGTNQHIAKRGTQFANMQWVDASDGVLFTFVQGAVADEWIVNHNLRARFVSVSVVPAIDVAGTATWYAPEGTVITPDIDYRTINRCHLFFTRPIQGTALIRR